MLQRQEADYVVDVSHLGPKHPSYCSRIIKRRSFTQCFCFCFTFPCSALVATVHHEGLCPSINGHAYGSRINLGSQTRPHCSTTSRTSLSTTFESSSAQASKGESTAGRRVREERVQGTSTCRESRPHSVSEHSIVNPPVLMKMQIGFLTEWQMYAQTIEGEAWRDATLDKGKIDKMSGERSCAWVGSLRLTGSRSAIGSIVRVDAGHTRKGQAGK